MPRRSWFSCCTRLPLNWKTTEAIPLEGTGVSVEEVSGAQGSLLSSEGLQELPQWKSKEIAGHTADTAGLKFEAAWAARSKSKWFGNIAATTSTTQAFEDIPFFVFM